MVLQRTRPEVRHLLAGNVLIEIRPGKPATFRDLDEAELLSAPEEIFGIALEPGDVQALRKRLAGP
jgi:N-hydroxyarylamine O-acetyltransferase